MRIKCCIETVCGLAGREPQLAGILAAFEASASDASAAGGEGSGSGVTVLALVGMGGVGKTQIVIEYCHTQYPLPLCAASLRLCRATQSPNASFDWDLPDIERSAHLHGYIKSTDVTGQVPGYVRSGVLAER